MFTRKPANNDGASHGAVHHNGSSPAPPPLNARPPQPQARRASSTPSVIGSDLSITGNLESAGEVQIEGEIQGDVQAGRIVVGEQANITGALFADEVVVGGHVQGSICGNNVTFQAASRIEGDVFHKTLAIEQGAYFEGKSRRSDNPMAQQRNGNGS